MIYLPRYLDLESECMKTLIFSSWGYVFFYEPVNAAITATAVAANSNIQSPLKMQFIIIAFELIYPFNCIGVKFI